MNKVVYNGKFGGFSLSVTAMQWLANNAREEIKAVAIEELANNKYFIPEIARHDPDLVRCVETLGSAANGDFADLRVRELKGNRYRIDVYDGYEDVFEPEDEEYITIE